jgi:hypothetical protein
MSSPFILASAQCYWFPSQAMPHADFVKTIHHGIPVDLHRPSFEPGSYVAFLGRISPEKRPDRGGLG